MRLGSRSERLEFTLFAYLVVRLHAAFDVFLALGEHGVDEAGQVVSGCLNGPRFIEASQPGAMPGANKGFAVARVDCTT